MANNQNLNLKSLLYQFNGLLKSSSERFYSIAQGSIVSSGEFGGKGLQSESYLPAAIKNMQNPIAYNQAPRLKKRFPFFTSVVWNSLYLILILFVISCKDEVLPKPNALLRLEYSAPEMEEFETEEYLFKYNNLANVKRGNSSSLSLEYPEMKGEIFINYRKVEDNIEKLLSDAQKLSYEHSVKADGILEQPFINEENQVYGMFYEVSGNAASQAQFYVTDSTEHFLTGSLYFMTRPNYDSIYPAAAYLQNDIRGIMESLRWR